MGVRVVGIAATMTRLRVLLGLALAVLAFGLATTHVAAQETAAVVDVFEDKSTVVDPLDTVAGATPTPKPEFAVTPPPIATPTPPPNPTPTPAPTRRDYITPGYGNAALQTETAKKEERAQVCDAAARPPTSRMLGIPGIVSSDSGPAWILLVVAVAAGAALFALIAFALRRTGGRATGPGPLEGIATLVAICAGLAGLAGQFIPGAAVKGKPPRQATMVVRDVKPRITRREYARKLGIDASEIPRADRTEVGNVIWLEIVLKGFKAQPLRLVYGLFDTDANQALLPGTGKEVEMTLPKHDVQTTFLPIWVGYPRSSKFRAEFRLTDREGVQQLAETGPLRGSRYRYACG